MENQEGNEPCIRLFYFTSFPNFGDLLSAELIEKLFHVPVVRENYTTAPLMAVGSILGKLLSQGRRFSSALRLEESGAKSLSFGRNLLRKLRRMRKTAKIKKKMGKIAKLAEETDRQNKIHIWGSGFLRPYDAMQKRKLIRPIEIHALRGRLTEDILLQLARSKGLDVERQRPFVLADPGLLAAKLITKRIVKKYDIGIVPHHHDAKNPVFRRMQKHYTNCLIIDVHKDPLTVIEQIASCETILSTSLHGLIVADSFNIPNRWCECSDKVEGCGFKFRDYYSSFDLEIEPLDLRKGIFPSIEDIKSQYKVSSASVCKKQEDLIKCFPFADKVPRQAQGESA